MVSWLQQQIYISLKFAIFIRNMEAEYQNSHFNRKVKKPQSFIPQNIVLFL